MRFLAAVAMSVFLLHPTPANGLERNLAGSRGPVAVSPAMDAPLRAVMWFRAVDWWNSVTAWNGELERQAVAARRASRKRADASRPPHSAPAPSYASDGRCGGSLPPCYVMMRESGGSLTARNRSGAAGKWQIMPGTWGGYGGYSSADQAPESVQDERARQIWNGGAGCSAWSTC